MKTNALLLIGLLALFALGITAMVTMFANMEAEHPMQNDTHYTQYRGLVGMFQGTEVLVMIIGGFIILILLIWVFMKFLK